MSFIPTTGAVRRNTPLLPPFAIQKSHRNSKSANGTEVSSSRLPAYSPPSGCRTALSSGRSAASSDMSYTNRADIYLGDVSSQVYEFLRQPRPCLFLNSHGVDWQDDPNYLHWRSGPVLTSAEGLIDAIDAAVVTHSHYAPVQQALIDSWASRSWQKVRDLSEGES